MKLMLLSANKHLSGYQRGVVLFVALIALVVMSLAAVALIRSVDTNVLINENLTFKQDAKLAADSGIESAIAWLSTNESALTADNTIVGYYSVCNKFDKVAQNVCIGDKLNDSSIWKPGVTSAYASGEGITGGKDANGNTIQYIVERMCKVTGDPTTENCQYGSAANTGGGHGEACYGGAACGSGGGGSDETKPSPIYRVTSRVTGPKNTVAYIQAFIF